MGKTFGKAKEMQMGMIAVLHLGTAIELASAPALYCSQWWNQ
jgi:hypothetical protein